MKVPSRRSFLGSAATAAAGLTLSTNQTSSAQGDANLFQKRYLFSIRPDVLAQIAQDNSIVTATAWAISDADQDLLPYLTEDIAVPIISDGAQVCEPCSGSGQVAAQWPLPQRFLDFRMLGQLPSTEIINNIVLARSLNQHLDLSISIADERTSQNAVISSSTIHADYFRLPTPTINGYFAQLRGPDPGGLSGCAPEAPHHFNLEVFKVNQWIPNTTIVNFHIAIWRQSSQICFALANSVGWPACFRKCSPSWNDIYQSVLSAMSSIGINFFVATVLASLIASIIYGSLAVLAVAA